MQLIHARNVHQALPEALYQLRLFGEERPSRNGPVRAMPWPVTTLYQCPTERVIFWPERDANPFFHLFESLWMLAGRDDVGYPAQFNSAIGQFSDDGTRFHGAYGFRWRSHFTQDNGQGWPTVVDQLRIIAEALRANPDDRRQVLAMWDPVSDLGGKGKDLPCNTHIYFQRGGKGELNMTVCCRSNDVVWGCYGANAVHFSILQEYMAAAIGCQVGRYWQVSNNWHLYTNRHGELMDTLAKMAAQPPAPVTCPYSEKQVFSYPLVNRSIEEWREDLAMFLSEGENATGYHDRFFRRVALPLLRAWRCYKADHSARGCEDAVSKLAECGATDWGAAAAEWLGRRKMERTNKESRQCQT